MGIDINPTGVLRSADSVEGAAQRLAAGHVPGHPGNPGFTTSEAIGMFAKSLEQSTALASAETATAAEKLAASATLMRRVDDTVDEVVTALWKKVV